MDILSGFAHVSLYQLALVAGVALCASIVGGVSGYGTGALMPLVLVPLIGAEPVVPIIAISAILSNTSRLTAFRRYADFRRATIVTICAVPTCALSAWGYTRLSSAGAALVIGGMLILSVPLRRHLKKRDFTVGDGGLALVSVGYGVVVGGTAGSGVILLSLLMAAGADGRRRNRDGLRDIDRHRHGEGRGVRRRRRGERAGRRLRAFDRHHGAAGRVSGAALCRAHAGARAHRGPRRGGVRGWDCDDRGGATKLSLPLPCG